MKITLKNIEMWANAGNISSYDETNKNDRRYKNDDRINDVKIGLYLDEMAVELEPRELPEMIRELGSVVKEATEYKRLRNKEGDNNR